LNKAGDAVVVVAGGDRRVVAALAERGGDATRPWREARSATAPTVSASFSECRPSGTHAVSDRVYGYPAQRAPCGESRCQPGRGQIRLFPEPARVGRRGRAPAMTERHRELPVRTEVARVAEGSGVGDRLAGHSDLGGDSQWAASIFSFWKTKSMLGWFLKLSRRCRSWGGAGAVFYAGLEDNNARNEGSCFMQSCNRLKESPPVEGLRQRGLNLGWLHCVVFLRRHLEGDRRADRRSFEPRRFGREDRGARGPDDKTESP
jgi:hypothetical protein